MKTFFAALILVFCICLVDFSDAKGIKAGGLKIKAPKIGPKISLPKGPRFPVILPLPIFIPLGGGFRRLKSNERVKCYTCEGDDKSLCALNPAGNVRQLTCQNSYYCSTVRKEVNDDRAPVENNITISSNPTKVNETTIVVVDGEQKSANESLVADAAEGNSTVVVESSSTTTETSVVENNNASIRSKREDNARVVISRGCKSLEFLDGFAVGQRSGSDANATERVYAQLCSSDLCNSGDGRLKCYECTGSGVDHPCMKSPTTVAKPVTCAWNEVCYVDRFSEATSNSENSTVNTVKVARGCRKSSLTVAEEGKIITRDEKLSLSCRLGSFCNSFDANKLVRTNASPGTNTASFSMISALVSLAVLGSRYYH